jgi:peroxiredoxin/mono/diheme cytochrome c family protein
MMRSTLACLALLSFAGPLLTQAPDTAPIKISDFRLKDSAGKVWSLADLKDQKAIVVVFVGTQCPINNAYMPRLAELHKEYAGKGVQFLAINANDHDTREAIADHAKRFAIPFPVLRDEKHLAADRFGAERTPEAFVLDADRAVRYRGRIDDHFGIGFQRPQPTRRDLATALDAVLAGKEVTQAKTAVAGCIIARAPAPKQAATVTYARDVARIVQQHCQECHRPGQIGPMPLLSYDDVSAWAQMIREVVEEKRMPPWHADPRHGKFRNDRSLSGDERKTLLAWIEQGCPRGDSKEPAPRQFAEGWSIGKPDVVFTMPKEFTVPAKAPKNGIPYKVFLVPTKFEEDVWVQAVEAKPGNRAVVHHIIVYVADGKKRVGESSDGIGNGLLVAHAPGDLALVFPPGHAKRIPKGATLAFQMHYTPSGTEESDRSSVALVFAKAPPTHEVKTRAIAQQLLLIPPGAPNHKVFVAGTFKKDVEIVSLFPHMHLRGKSFEYQAIYPDGKREVILSVPRYDFGWQTNYFFESPLRLPAGSRIECTAHFDNSKDNPSNPDPTRLVHWGEQTWDEMMIGFVDYAAIEEPRKDEKK